MCVTVVPQGETHVYADKYFVSPVPPTWIDKAEVSQSCGHHKKIHSCHPEHFLGPRYVSGHQLPTGDMGPKAPQTLLCGFSFSGWASVRWVPSLELCPAEQNPHCSPALSTLVHWQEPDQPLKGKLEVQPQNFLGNEYCEEQIFWVQKP